MAVTVTFETSLADTANQTVYTYTAADIGVEAADRIVVVAVHGVTGTSPNSNVASVTVAGVSATMAARNSTNTAASVEIWYAEVPTGTTGDIVVTYGEAQARSAIGIWTLTGADPAPTDTDNANGAGASIDLTALTVPTDGAAIVGWVNGTSGVCAWTNATERYDAAFEATNRYSGADTTTAGLNTINANGDTATQVIAGAAWGPTSTGQPTSKRSGGVAFMGAGPHNAGRGGGVWSAPKMSAIDDLEKAA